eukprot:tig00000331_g24151.t1
MVASAFSCAPALPGRRSASWRGAAPLASSSSRAPVPVRVAGPASRQKELAHAHERHGHGHAVFECKQKLKAPGDEKNKKKALLLDCGPASRQKELAHAHERHGHGHAVFECKQKLKAPGDEKNKKKALLLDCGPASRQKELAHAHERHGHGHAVFECKQKLKAPGDEKNKKKALLLDCGPASRQKELAHAHERHGHGHAVFECKQKLKAPGDEKNKKKALLLDCGPASRQKELAHAHERHGHGHAVFECKQKLKAPGDEKNKKKALLLDCGVAVELRLCPVGQDLLALDGVIADTEPDGHRVSFNRAFKAFGIDTEFDRALHDRLPRAGARAVTAENGRRGRSVAQVKVGGGKELMSKHFDEIGWPKEQLKEHGGDKKKLIAELHKVKTEFFMDLVNKGEIPGREGITRIVDEAIAAGYRIAVCSTGHVEAVSGIMKHVFGEKRLESFDGLFAGDMVPKKKPDPAIYTLASKRLDVPPESCSCAKRIKLKKPSPKCVVIEDSRIGLLAAKAAGMPCLITRSGYTQEEDFHEADLVVFNLDDGNVGLDTLERLIKRAVHGRGAQA